MRPRGGGRRAAVAVGLAVFCAAATEGRAQEGPLVLGRRAEAPVLSLDPIHGSLDFNGLFSFSSSKSGSSSANATDTLFQESVGLSTGGGIVSKNLVDWRVAGAVGLNEEWSHSPTDTVTNYGLFHTYDVEATLLRTTELPVSVFARRSEDYLNRSYAALLKNTVQSYGGMVDWRSATLPTTLRVSRTETEQSDLGGAAVYNLNQNDLEFQTEWQPTDRQMLTLNYQFSGIEQSNIGIAGMENYSIQTANATHTWAIDPNSRYTLTQTLNYAQQTGAFAYDHLRLGEQLRMRHTETFETNLNYNFDQQGFLTTDSTTHQVSAGFSHQLFQSLTTSGTVGYSTTDRSFSGTSGGGDSTSDNQFASLGFGYNKKVPLGRLAANLSLGYSQTDNGPVGSVQQVVGEQHTFVDPAPIILTQAQLNPSSIAVFNATGTRKFIPGLDYVVEQVGNTVQIRRQVGGNIDSGDQVRLNYDIDPLPGYVSTTTNFGTGARYDFTEGLLNGLGLYVQYLQQDQTITETTVSAATSAFVLRPDNVRDTLLGAEYRIWKLTFRAEDETRDSTLSPSNAQRFSAVYADRLGQRSTVNVIASQSFIQYPTENNDTNLTMIDGRLEYQIDRYLRAVVSARWRNEEDTRFGNIMGFEELGELQWRIRQTRIFLTARHTSLTTQGDETQNLIFQFGIRREF